MRCTTCKSKSCRTGETCKAVSFDTEEIKQRYTEKNVQKIVQIAAKLVDNGRAGTLSRLEEIIEFCHLNKYKRIGLAYCYGMEKEAIEISKYIKLSGLRVIPVSCTVGGYKENDFNQKTKSQSVACNPIGQAEQLNQEKVQLTLTMGLCLGHDILFQKHIKSDSTTLVVKDRVHHHNPLEHLSKTS